MGIYAHRVVKIETDTSSFRAGDLELIMDYDKLDADGCGLVSFSFNELEEVLENEDTPESVKKAIREDMEKSDKEGKDYAEYYFF